ncbi:hypothetical protein CkaCkLH20_11006 [Colletotrichum karsti]|uniref:Uncharacterized protein n=1 Tax=Colletotrichum karsti TaxID=1095194 RepID=A0A9P6HWW6_9PEZI|nr:uncharacterized protein CkaCkLH20_11006 [Colletotrichum karsti]KAF9871595.1 hypothetical protein CkaCkLH20_11006 [Colletotrichum karsti]
MLSKIASTEMASHEISANEMAGNEMVANDMATNEMASHEMVANDMASTNIATANLTVNDTAITNIATTNMAANGMASDNMASNNMATNNAQASSQGPFLPNEIWAEIIEQIPVRKRTIGVAPDLDNRALRPPVPAIAHVNRQIRRVFQSTYATIRVSTPQPTRGILSINTYISPHHDTMTLGYDTNELNTLVDLIKAPLNPVLVNNLKQVWLADLNIPRSAGYFGIDPAIANRPVDDIDRFPLTDLIYKNLEVITLSSEKYDWDLKDEESTAYGFDIVYHVQTGLVFMNPIRDSQEGDWLNARSGKKHFNDEESFLTRIKIDRSDNLAELLKHESFEAVIKQKGHKVSDADDDPVADIEEAPDVWCYNWQVCVDYIKLRLT